MEFDFANPLPSTTFNSTATTQTVTGLTNGSRYRFRVAAINSLGVGQRSQTWSDAALIGVQAAPTIGTATPGNEQVTVTWSAPTSNGSPPVTGYTVTAYVVYLPILTATFASTATTQTIHELSNGTTYRFRVQAVNAIGTGAFSKVSNPVTPSPTAPTAPTIGTATAGDGQATVSWTAPASDGGSAITGYVVTPYVGYYPLPSQSFASTATTQVVTGLTNGTTYRFRVQAVNAIGTSGYSKVTNPVTPTA
jgi:predicted phage tail protein